MGAKSAEQVVKSGQVYLHRKNACFVVIVRTKDGVVLFGGDGIYGRMDAYMFLRRTKPVDPATMTQEQFGPLLTYSEHLTPGYVGRYSEMVL